MVTIRVYYRGNQEVDEAYTLKTMSVEVSADGVALVTFTRAKQMNSLSYDFKHELMLVYEYLKRNEEVRAVVWTGQGNFSAGADLTAAPLTVDAEIVAGYKYVDKGVFDDDLNATNWRSFSKVAFNFPKPSIAAVNGFAIGGAANMVFLYHDHVIAGASTKFRFPFGLMSLIPEFGSTFLLAPQVGMLRAKEMLLLAEWIPAADAKTFGVVNKVVPDSDVVAEAMKVAKFLADKDPTWFRKAKEMLHKQFASTLDADLQHENDVFTAHMESGVPLQAMAKYMMNMAAEKKAKKAKL